MKFRILGLLAVGVLAAPISVNTAPITYNVLFAGTAPLPSGTITFADSSDPDIGTGTVLLSDLTYSFFFTDGTRTWTDDDPFLLPFSGPIPTATFVGGTLVGLDFSVNDGDPTYGQFRLFYTNNQNSRVWRTNVAGTYYFEEAEINPVPEPGTLALLGLGLGLAGLGLSRRCRA